MAFAPGTTALASVVQQGDFHYSEGPRSATSDSARYTAAIDLLALSGSPRYSDAGLSVTANSLSVNRRTGELRAQGDVKTTYEARAAANQQPARGGDGQSAAAGSNAPGAMLSNSSPVHVTAPAMVAQRATGVARFSGGARLWQNANIVQAPAIEFNRDRRSMLARGTTQQRVETVFVETGQNGRTTPVNITAQTLIYAESDQKGRFDGGVVVRGADATLNADHMDIFLKPPQSPLPATAAKPATTSPEGPARVQRIVAEGNIVLTQPTRKATGEKLVYTAAEDKFVLTGGPPSIFDAEHGKITGDSLTLFGQGDSVLVQSRNKSQMVIQTRVTK